MQNSTFIYIVDKLDGKHEFNNAAPSIIGLSDKNMIPSERSIQNIMAFANAYRYNKSENLGQVEYLIN